MPDVAFLGKGRTRLEKQRDPRTGSNPGVPTKLKSCFLSPSAKGFESGSLGIQGNA
jgi:hypothetical protein